MGETLAIDLETYSSVDLTKTGVRPYTEAPDFTILLAAYQVDNGPVKILDFEATMLEDPEITMGDRAEFEGLLFDPTVVKTAYNAAFERACLAKFYDRPMPPEEWRCTMIQAATLGLPGKLEDVGAVLGLNKQKLVEGKELIRYFCQPGPKGRRPPQASPERWAQFRRYCVRDVEAESEIRNRLAKYPRPQVELDAWALDQRINDRGVRLDRVLVERAQELDALYTARLMDEARKLTGLENPNSGAQLTNWLETRGLEVPNLQKETIPELLAAAPDDTTRRVLQLRQELAKTSVTKYEAMSRALCKNGRAHNFLQFYGASRTGRWAGRLVQVQNLPQNKLPDLALARELVRSGEYDLLELLFGSPSFVLSQLIRTAFIPAEGCRFIVCDYSAIEARVLAWLAGETWVLEEFYGDGLIYEATAAMMFHLPKNEIRKGGPHADLRPKGKVATLACGYQGGVNALVNMGALDSGIPVAELPGIVKRWRAANKNIVRFWYDVEDAAISAVKGRPRTLPHGLRFERDSDYLFITLPSGRRLAYFKPELRHEAAFDKDGVTYLGTDTNKHFQRQKTYGGKLVENITQATARDCLRDAMTALDAAGYKIVFHVHDEVILEVPCGTGSLREVQEIMGRPLPWAPGLPLRGDGDEMNFYMKT